MDSKFETNIISTALEMDAGLDTSYELYEVTTELSISELRDKVDGDGQDVKRLLLQLGKVSRVVA